MIKLCSVEEIRAAERAAGEAGQSERDLMLTAGHGVARVIAEAAGEQPGTALFFVGPGNNGGDGLVAAADLIARGWQCFVWGYQRTSGDNVPIKPTLAGKLVWLDELRAVREAAASADVIVDAVFGIGGRAALPDDVAKVFEIAWENRVARGTPLVALDIPSGTDADTGAAAETAFRADHTVMVGLPKVGLYRVPAARHTGVLHLVDIGLPAPPLSDDSVALITEEDVRRWLPRREADTHKRAVGTLLIVGGAPNYYGAPRLSAGAAVRVGTGLVTLAVSRSLIGSIAAALPEVTFLPLPEGDVGGAGVRMADLIHEHQADYRALLIGPGLGKDPAVDEFLGAFFGLRPSAGGIGFGVAAEDTSTKRFDGNAVIDADGLNWLAKHPDWPERLRHASVILTPHPGELSRLLDTDVSTILDDPWGQTREAARRFGQIVVLKLGHSVVATPEGQLIVAPQALPSVATAGTGDVLAGTIAGLLAQGMSPVEAAAGGLMIGTLSALRVTRELGTLGLAASDLIEAMPAVMRDLFDARW